MEGSGTEGWAEIVAGVQAAWADAFGRRDVPALAAFYTPDAAFYGSSAELFRGQDGVARYFTLLPPRFKRARFAAPALVVLAPEAVAASGPVTFETAENGVVETLRYRMTHVMVQRDGHTRIATHHASPEP